MTTFASDIIGRVSTVLFDTANIKWSVAEMLLWIGDGERAIVSLVPEASSTVTNMLLSAGARQTIPAGGWMLLEATRNMGSNGSTPGRVLKREDRATLDETNPEWYSQPEIASPSVYMYNVRDRQAFYVNPPADGTGYIEINYSAVPPVIANSGQALIIDDIYVPALCDYVLWRAKSKLVPFAGDPKDAAPYLVSFAMYVGKDVSSIATLAAQMGQLGSAPLQGQGSGDNTAGGS